MEVTGRQAVIHDGQASISADVNQVIALNPGVLVEVTGIAVQLAYRVALQHAVISASPTPIGSSEQSAPIRTAQAIRAMSAAEAGKHYPVELRAQVTYFDPYLNFCYVRDSTSGIFIGGRVQTGRLAQGDLVRIMGLTAPGSFAPIVSNGYVSVIGHKKMPRAPRVSPVRAAAGLETSQWVEIEGIVHPTHVDDNGRTIFDIATSFGPVQARCPSSLPDGLIDAKVRVSGTFGTMYNRYRQMIGYTFHVAAPGNMRILEPPVEADRQPPAIHSLLEFSPKRMPGHRQTVQGTVTMVGLAGMLYLQDSSGGLEVQR
jgi:hypothetical protein